ncbi:unnamed protein product [Nesidiocoris tenuis]|uniref:Uncharacterized protein n=1 Tax=Nesidiocoris tenuis TaxID=355587 RepID=A0A6H5HVN3_9HEMI|nr:unnamed protein product [Nesidiocoris tenuis]
MPCRCHQGAGICAASSERADGVISRIGSSHGSKHQQDPRLHCRGAANGAMASCRAGTLSSPGCRAKSAGQSANRNPPHLDRSIRYQQDPRRHHQGAGPQHHQVAQHQDADHQGAGQSQRIAIPRARIKALGISRILDAIIKEQGRHIKLHSNRVQDVVSKSQLAT